MILRLLPGFVLYVALGSSALSQTVSGTGFFISSDGYVVTNNHVTQGVNTVRIKDSGGVTYDAEVVRMDTANDLAILKVTGSGFIALPIRSSSGVQKGASVFTIGFPNVSLQGSEAKLTEGVISSLSGIGREPNNFQISVALQPGNSGGPLLDSSGAVVGVVAAKLSPTATLKRSGSLPENVNYAVKSNYLMELVSTVPGLDAKLRKPSAAKGRPLTLLVAEAERSVVFIVGKKRGAEGGAATSPSPSLSPDSRPRYERDAEGTELNEKGMQSYKNGNYTEALRLLGKAAEANNANAQLYLGHMYANGRGVAKDNAEAVRWYRMAAEQGVAIAQTALGGMYMFGRGVAKDDAEAVRWYRKAAEQGFATAQAVLGAMLAAGSGVRLDYAEALEWSRKAAGQGSALAQKNLGLHYEKGYGVAKDDTQAVQWYRKAAAQGEPTAIEALKRLGVEK